MGRNISHGRSGPVIPSGEANKPVSVRTAKAQNEETTPQPIAGKRRLSGAPLADRTNTPGKRNTPGKPGCVPARPVCSQACICYARACAAIY